MAATLRVGFVGVGTMGNPMAANIARAGASLTVYDADPDVAEAFAREHSDKGVTAAPDLRTLGRDADIVVTMLPTGHIVRQVMVQGGLADALAAGSVVVDMSSSEPIGTRELGALLSPRGIALVDAPVSGALPKAIDGTLAIMIGADDDAALAKVEPVLRMMGDRLYRVGGLGNGHAMKALNNYVAAATFVAASEALIVGEKFGLDRAVMVDVFNASTARSFNTELPIKQHVLTRKFASGFQLGLMAKDVGIAGDLGESIGIDAPLSRLVRDMWADARDHVGATEDFSKAITRWEEKNGNPPE